MQSHQEAGHAVIRPARPAEAPAIYALLREVFGERFLSYTIYQAQESTRYLAEVIGQGPEGSGQRIFVSCAGEALGGYYHAIVQGEEYFLNYIAVVWAAMHRGLGTALLTHYEQTGFAAGCEWLALDVFESNEEAHAWYARRGYRVHKATYSVRVDMKAMGPDDAQGIYWEEADLEKALLDERRQGFGKLECRLRGGRIVLGVIGGRSCRLLGIESLDLAEAIAAVSGGFGTDREALIVSSLSEVPRGLPVLSSDKSLRMRKPAR